jgi:hypothetical protein
VASDGTVTISDLGDSDRVFQPDARFAGTYLPSPGDHSTLTAEAGGAFTVQDIAGTAVGFRSDGKLDYMEDTNGDRITAGYADDLLATLTHSSGQAQTTSQ